jgi:hypothetical protein
MLVIGDQSVVSAILHSENYYLKIQPSGAQATHHNSSFYPTPMSQSHDQVTSDAPGDSHALKRRIAALEEQNAELRGDSSQKR